MKGQTKFTLSLSLLVLAMGCAPQVPLMDQKRDTAIQTATARAQFELGCSTTTATILSQNLFQPVLEGPLVQGPQRAEYTIGVAGCDKKAEYVVVCPSDGTGCFAADSRGGQGQ